MAWLSRKAQTFLKLVRCRRNEIPVAIFNNLARTGIFDRMNDAEFLRLSFRLNTGQSLDLSNPRTFNEKLQWLKIHDRNPMYTQLVDKFRVKDWVRTRLGEQYIVPTFGCWAEVEDVDISSLPEKFVLKTNDDSGVVVVCSDKENFDLGEAKKRLKRSRKKNLYYRTREWPYKNVQPCVLAEQLLEAPCDSVAENPGGPQGDLVDYKFMCFSGKVQCIFTCSNRASGDLRVDFFDREWDPLPFTRRFPRAEKLPSPPKTLLEMIWAAESLAVDLPFVRVDFYEVEGRCYFGEMTFYPGSGYEKFEPNEWDTILGNWLDLSLAWDPANAPSKAEEAGEC